MTLQDPVAVAYVIDPTIFETRKMRVDIDTSSELSRCPLRISATQDLQWKDSVRYLPHELAAAQCKRG